jgi:hypothetical protein
VETNEITTLSKAKSFSLKKLLSVGIASNYMANYHYGLVHSATTDIAHDNKNFKATSFENTSFHNQVLKLTRASFELSFENLPEHLITYGPFLRSHIAYRESLEKIVGEDIISIQNTAIGENSFLIFKIPSGLAFFNIERDKTELYKTNIKTLKEFRKFFKLLQFKRMSHSSINTEFNSLIAMDFMANPKKININFYQLYYEYLYKISGEILKSGNKRVISKLIQSHKSVLKAIEALKRDDSDKFVQNLSDLIKAVEDEDLSYFGGSSGSPGNVSV